MCGPRCLTWSNNMRVIEKNMIAAIKAGRSWKEGNTEVCCWTSGGWEYVTVLLFGNTIAKITSDTATAIAAPWQFTLAGWNTPTTRSRVTELMREFSKEYLGVRTEKGQPYVVRRDHTSFPITSDEWVG
ncbi:hypothetical protein AVU43_gp03 [Ralstonia phage RSJ5]|uniref:Uncharacterized protein n=1 Tax=Ralstonia phage RSJ5 TaxID=1538364 RepID=A0A077KTH7_9CAUD|nr:hypothetical protein AVU43_gp03 [Ralstonia phage RSJ5]BAP34897.1 hypothetical protein [Ralstonia phage RSJ5]